MPHCWPAGPVPLQQIKDGHEVPVRAFLYLGAGELSGNHWPPVVPILTVNGCQCTNWIPQLESSCWSVTECRMSSTMESTARGGQGKALSYISCLIIISFGGPRNSISAEMALGKAQKMETRKCVARKRCSTMLLHARQLPCALGHQVIGQVRSVSFFGREDR